MSLIGAPLILCLVAPADEPAPKFPLGKETTYVTGPLDKDGYIDYEPALNDRLAKGITAETNANVLLWKAFGPAPEGRDAPAEVFQRMGMDPPPKDGSYYVGLGQFLKDSLKLDPGQFEAIYDQQQRASKRPWTAKDYPPIAEWLEANEKPLALIVEATKRPDYYNPLVSRGSLIGALIPSAQKCRDAASALTDRAMLRVASGKYDDAWQDLLACHRLGRLVARGGTLIEGMVGIAADNMASNADLAYLERADWTAKQIDDRRKELQGLPPMPSMADQVDLLERFTYLESVGLVRRNGLGVLEGMFGYPPSHKPDAEELKALDKIDWEPALRDGNRWYDRVVEAMRIPDRADRKKALEKIENELKALREKTGDETAIAKLWTMNPPDKGAGKQIGDILICALLPAVSKAQNAHDRNEQIQRNLQVAFALAAYQKDHGDYPAKLDDLAPKYLAAVPDDLFSGKPLIYRPADKGYLFYSVGINGVDDGGRSADDDPKGDDLPVRVPLPELKPAK